MTEIVKVEFDASQIVTNVDKGVEAFQDLQNAVSTMSKQTGQSLKTAKLTATEFGKDLLTVAQVTERGMQIANSNLKNSTNYQVRIVTDAQKAIQNQYENSLGLLRNYGESIKDEDLRRYSAQGARLTSAHKARMAMLRQYDREDLQQAKTAAADAIALRERQARQIQEIDRKASDAEAAWASRKTSPTVSKEDAWSKVESAQRLANEQKTSQQVIAWNIKEGQERVAVQKAADAQIAAYEKVADAERLAQQKAADAAALAAHKSHLNVLNGAIGAANAKRLSEESALQAALLAMDKTSAAKRAAAQADYTASLYKGKGNVSQVVKEVRANPTIIPDNTGSKLKEAALQANNLDASFKKLVPSGNDVHSMARGLASGFGALWLTWGNLVPLLAGAAVSNGFMQTAKSGMEIAHTLAIIENLGGATRAEILGLNDEIIRMGKVGPFGPKEISDAMKTLSLAGMEANEILAVTQDVLNFSVAGTTDLKTAADTLVSVSTAFGMGAEGFGRVSDVIAKTAATSKSSVESISEAMKTASVISEQYGVKLEDTGTALAALSQLGIEGSAAGTALRNMYADLSGRSVQVAKVLKAQGIEMRTATGAFKPMINVVQELDDKFKNLDGIGQKNLMQAILSERGAKGIVEMLRMINTEAKDAGSGFANALQESQASITNSYGFAAIQAAKLAQTTQNQFKSVGSALQTSMYQAYQSMEPALTLLADGLQKAFNDPAFVGGLTTMVNNVAQLSIFLMDNAKTLTYLVASYAAVRLAMLALPVAQKIAEFTGLTAATVANTAATTANAAAQGAAGAARIGVLGTLGRFLPYVGQAIAVGSVAWAAWDLWSSRAVDTADRASRLYQDKTVKALQDEATRLETLNALRAQGLSLSEAELRMKGVKDKDTSNQGILELKKEAEGLKAQLDAAIAKRDKIDKAGKPYSQVLAEQRNIDAIEQKLTVTRKQLTAASRAYADAEIDRADAEKRISDAMRVSNDRQQKEIADRMGKNKFGDGTFELGIPGADKAANKALSEREKAFNEQVKLAENAATREQRVMKDNYDTQQNMLDSKHRNQLITEGAFQAQSLANMLAYEEAASKARAESVDKRVTMTGARIQQLQADEAAGITTHTATEEAIKGVVGEMWRFIESMDELENKQSNNAMERFGKSMDNAAGAVKKLNADVDKFIRQDLIDLAAGTDAASFAIGRYGQIAAEAGAKQTAKFGKEITELTVKLEDAQTAYDELKAAGLTTPEGIAATTNAAGLVTSIQAAIDKLKTALEPSVKTAIENGVNKAKAEDFRKFSSSVADAIIKGGEEGAADLRTILENEFLNKPFKLLLEGVMQDIKSGGGASAQGGGIVGAVKEAKNIYDAVTTGFKSLASYKDLGGTIVKGLGQVGMQLGEYGMQALGDSVIGAANYIGQFARQINQVSDGLGYLNTALLASEGKWGAAIGSAIGTYFGGAIGSSIGASIGGWVDGLFGGGSEYAKATGVRGTIGKSGMTGSEYTLMHYDGNRFNTSSSKDYYKDTAIGKGTSDMLTNQFTAIQTSVAGFAQALGADTAMIEYYHKAIDIEFLNYDQINKVAELNRVLKDTGASAEAKTKAQTEMDAITKSVNEKIAAFFGTVASEMAALVVNPDFQRAGENSADTLARLATSLSVVNETSKTLGYSLFEVSQAGGNAASNLLEAFGGLENYTNAISEFYKNTYTAAEREAAGMAQLDSKFKGLGFEAGAPKDAAAYRAMVEDAAKNRGTAAGDKFYVSLLALGTALFEFIPTADEATKAVDEATSTAKTAADIASERASLQEEYNQLTMTELELTALKRAELDASNQGLFDSIQLAKAAKAIEEERKSLQDQLNEATMTDVELLALRRNAISEENRALFDSVQAANAAKAALASFNNSMKSLGDQGFSLQNEWMTLNGQDTEVATRIRTKELADLTAGLIDPAQIKAITDTYDANEAWRQKIKQFNKEQADAAAAQQAATEAANNAARAAEEAARAAEAVRDAWQSVTDSLFGEVSRIKKLMFGDTQQGYASAQAAFTITAAQAKAGDQEAAKLLPGLSQALLELANTQASSLSELRFMQASTAGVLEALGLQYAGQYGLKVPSYDVGTNYVPRDMLAMVHEGEAIVPKEYNPSATPDYLDSGAQDNSGLIAELRELRTEIQALKSLQARNNMYAKKTSENLDRVTDGSDSVRVEVVPA